MKIYTIYRSLNKINNKSYIGFDSNWPSRKSNHANNVKNGISTIFYNAIRKHGWDNFEWTILYQSIDKNHTKNVMEEYFIREYNTYVDNKCGYNMTYGGDGNNGHCQKTIDRLREIRIGKKMGPCSEETKRKIGLAKKGKKMSEEQKEYYRKLYTGTKYTEERIKTHSKHYIAISPDGQEYSFYNLSRFCKQNNLNQGAMSAVTRGVKKHHKKWKCSFDVNEKESIL